MKDRLNLLIKAGTALLISAAIVFTAVFFAVLLPARTRMSIFRGNGRLAKEDAEERVYGQTYYAALPAKYDRMISVGSPKLTVVGGSNIAFGFDSALAEKELGIPCVNLGLYAAIGFDYMLDLALEGAGNGDIIVLIPETDAQMYSDFFGTDAIIRATEGRSDMRAIADKEDRYLLESAFSAYSAEKCGYIEKGTKAPASGVYASSSFNERGDMIFPRPENVMDGYYKSDALPDFRTDIITDTFVSMVNEFTSDAQKKGASVYFSFPPINELSAKDVGEDQLSAFVGTLSEKLDCKVISSLSDRLLPAGYFYDSNYHCNDTGMIANTALLIADILRLKNDMRSLSFTVPAAPEVITEPVSELMEENGFLYTSSPSGITITGLTVEKKKAATLEVPDSISGFAVTKIADRAFAGCSAQIIIIPASIKTLGGYLFEGAQDLKIVELRQDFLPAVGDMLLSGANENVILKVNGNIYDTYLNDYFWMGYKDRLSR